jgi:hypothetical protein
MSLPETRLVSDSMAERLGRDAAAILSAELSLDPALRMPAVGVSVLLRDSGARQELAAMSAEHRAEVVARPDGLA